MDKGAGDLVELVEDQAVVPRRDGRTERAVREAVDNEPQCRTGGQNPDVGQQEDVEVIAKVEQEVVECTALLR